MSFQVPEKCRIVRGPMATSKDGNGNNGAFIVPHPNRLSSLKFYVIASDGEGWEHVSVSLKARTPTWEEMCFIKALFWSGEDMVLQYHPPESAYVDVHPNCLHLWRPVGVGIPHPPQWMV